MSEALATIDGQPVDMDASESEFAAAMAAPPADKPGMTAPPRKPPEPPADPQAAPHGWTWKDGGWRAKHGPGRPRTAADKPRVTRAPAAGQAANPKTDKTGKDYR